MVDTSLAQGLARLLFEMSQVGFWGWGCFLGLGVVFGFGELLWGCCCCFWVWLLFYLLAGSGLVGCSLPAVGGTPGKRGSESQKEKLNWEE